MKKKVLIVEDNELNMKLFEDLLGAHGYDTAKTRDGRNVLEIARAEKPALQPVVFREADAFAFKVLDAKKTVLATQGGFADPKAAMAAARAAMEALV